MGREVGLLAHRLPAIALCGRGQPRAGHRFRQEAHAQAGGRGRPLYLPGHDGRTGPPWRARSHRRRAPLDRRSVPAAQDRRGTRAGHPRVHRLQHLHLELARWRAGALHTEPDDRRGVAPRLASRAHRRGSQRSVRTGGGRRSGRARMCVVARAARLRGERRGSRRRHRRAAALRDAPAGTCRLGAGPRVASWAARAAAERDRLPRQPPQRAGDPGARQRARGHRHRLALGTPAVLRARDPGGYARGSRGVHTR